ncbi:hypothetical protein CSKR_105808 [Clonorchis sinensis]|uniref:Uncharacterized protein n=1 Tax=Clonorchis sinensis TaxID=79923 RepID=A0A419PV50_CLOSI|nr:hypothetical protein CSKR_105808 [Clonorchis sinensis]
MAMINGWGRDVSVVKAQIYCPKDPWFESNIRLSISLYTFGELGSIPALVLPLGGMAAKHRKGVRAEQLFLGEMGKKIQKPPRNKRLSFSQFRSHWSNGRVAYSTKHPLHIRNALLIRLLKILRQPTTGFALLGAHQVGAVPEFPSTLCST